MYGVIFMEKIDNEIVVRLQRMNKELLKTLDEAIAENEQLKAEIKKLKEQNGGRPSKLTEEQKATIEMYRVQGKTIKEIAEMFNCSTRTVDRILKKRKEEK